MTAPRPIAILGAGNMGTALAQVLAGNGACVLVWDFFPEVVQDINARRRNESYLPGIALHHNVSAASSPAECAHGANVIVLAVPSPFVHATLREALPAIADDAVILNAAKGIDSTTRVPIHHGVISQIGLRAFCQLAGPAIANEFSRGLPAAVVLASPQIAVAERLRTVFEGDVFRVAVSDDVEGAALGGILKNVYAILLGYLHATASGARNLEAAALSASLREMAALSEAFGAKPHTIYGLAGLGDLVATGFSDDSHNRRFGSMLGQGDSTAEIEAKIGMLPEGARTVDIACGWAREKGVAVPVAEFVRELVAGTKPPLKRLLSHLC